MTELAVDCIFCESTAPPVWTGHSVYLLLDVAPLVEGHALVCSRDHLPSSGDVPPDVARELDNVSARLRSIYLKEYGAFTMFEHGRTGHCIRHRPEERACNHLHVHVLPLPGDLLAEVGLSQRVEWTSWAEVGELAQDIDGYVLVETVAAGRLFFPVARTLEPHYLRTRAATVIGDPDAGDWERRAGEPAMLRLVERGRDRLAARLAHDESRIAAQ